MKKRSVKQEFDATKEFLVQLRATFPDASIYWLKGNHCVRWEKFLEQKVREIWDDPYFHLEERLRLNEQKVQILDDTVLVKAGKLSITHGHHIFKGIFVPVSPARGAFLRAKQSVIVGHLHRSSYHTEMDLDGKVIGCWSTGSLCELRPNYSPLVSNAHHGFAHILVEKDGSFVVKNYQIINGKLH
jgi:predicted phosphodiesterase